MSILGSIMSSVLGRPQTAAPPPAAPSREEPHASAPPVASHGPTHTAASASPPAHTDQPSHAPPPTPTHAAAAAAAHQVDVAAAGTPHSVVKLTFNDLVELTKGKVAAISSAAG